MTDEQGAGGAPPPPPPPAAGDRRPLQANGMAEAAEPSAKRAHVDGAGPDTVLRLLLSEAQLQALQRPASGDGGGGGGGAGAGAPTSAPSALDTAASSTGATVAVVAPTAGCRDRVAVVYAPAGGSPDAACAALQRLASVLLSGGGAAAEEEGEPGGPRRIGLRLLVGASQAEGLTGADAEALAAVQGGSGVQLQARAAGRGPGLARRAAPARWGRAGALGPLGARFRRSAIPLSSPPKPTTGACPSRGPHTTRSSRL
jgi:hypothetical protein